jgi:hypothetical protein
MRDDYKSPRACGGHAGPKAVPSSSHDPVDGENASLSVNESRLRDFDVSVEHFPRLSTWILG